MTALNPLTARHELAAPEFRPAYAEAEGSLSRRQRWYLRLRRVMDIVIACIGLLLLSPLLGVIALVIIAVLGRPAVYVQERVTMGSRTFSLYKFRTMRVFDRERGLISDEDRMTPLGSLLRASSLDELPGLWNVLRGDMSIIGPRPLLSCYLPRYSAEQLARHRVPAGVTGLAQVQGRNTVPWEERMALDMRYVEELGLRLDLWILIRTVAVVLSRSGVTEEGQATMTSFPGPLRTRRIHLRPGVEDGSWTAVGPDGAELVSCAVRRHDEHLAVLSFSLVDGGRSVPADPRFMKEAVTLVLTRARMLDVEYAACPAGGLDERLRSALRAHGFEELGAVGEDCAPSAAGPVLLAFIANDDG